MTIRSVLQRGTVNPRYFSLNYSSYPHILNGFDSTYKAQLGRKGITLAKNKHT